MQLAQLLKVFFVILKSGIISRGLRLVGSCIRSRSGPKLHKIRSLFTRLRCMAVNWLINFGSSGGTNPTRFEPYLLILLKLLSFLFIFNVLFKRVHFFLNPHSKFNYKKSSLRFNYKNR